ncbi:unnamed protein product [Choristocarpus tenellus]
MNVVQEIQRINQRELEHGLTGKSSWHYQYRNSAWVFVGGLPYDLTEGDVVCVMSQWGEIEDINLVREKDTGKSKGFCFLKYEDQRSTILAVDNFNGVKLLGRTLRVDHKDKYSLPKEVMEREEKLEEERVARGEAPTGSGPSWRPGVAYEGKELANDHNIHKGVDVFAKPKESQQDSDSSEDDGSQGVGARNGGNNGNISEKRRGGDERREGMDAKKARKEARNAKKEAKKAKKKAKEQKKDKKKHQGDKGDSGDVGGGRDVSQEAQRYESREGRQLAGADADGLWERGVAAGGRTVGNGMGIPLGVFAPERTGLPPTPSFPTSGVMDWRGAAAQGGGRGGDRGQGQGWGRGRGRLPEAGAGRGRGRGAGDVNSFGGMDRRR